jgi:GMP synthase-like glutamine amidotransferase
VRVGVVANIEDPEAGFVEERLEAMGAGFVRRWRSDPESLFDLERVVDLVVLLGSDWSVHGPAHRSEIGAEIDLVRRARTYGCPTLGICFGGQVVAAALGLEVARAPIGEIGWVSLESDRRDLVADGPWFAYHLDGWRDAGEHRAIARNQAGPQAVLDRRTLGVQFHPEVTDDVIERWLRNGGDDLALIGVDPAAVMADTDRFTDGARERCHALVDAFLALVATAPARAPGESEP